MIELQDRKIQKHHLLNIGPHSRFLANVPGAQQLALCSLYSPWEWPVSVGFVSVANQIFHQFSGLMEAIIKGLVGVLVYINNLLIHSNTNEIKSLATTRPGLLSLTDIIQTTTKPTNPGAILEFCLQHYWSYHITSSIDQHISLLIIILHTQNFLKPYPSLSAYTLITIIPT